MAYAMCAIMGYLLILIGFGLIIPRWLPLLGHTAGIYLFLNLLRVLMQAKNVPGFSGWCHDCTLRETAESDHTVLAMTFIALIMPIMAGLFFQVIFARAKRLK